MAVIAVSSSSLVVEALSKVRVVSNCKVVVGGKDLKAEVLDTVKHNTLLNTRQKFEFHAQCRKYVG